MKPSFAEEVRFVMIAPGFARANDGDALPSKIARRCRRSVTAVQRALKQGEQDGIFTSRPHAIIRSPRTGEPAREYKALPGRAGEVLGV